MNLEIEIGGKRRSVEFKRQGRRVEWRIDGRKLEADAVEVAPGIYSILIGGQSFEVRVEPRGPELHIHTAGRELRAAIADPRHWRGRRAPALGPEGRQQVPAPMSGKVVRVLVNAGDAVEAAQGLLVIEAMKMQNEVRSPKKGFVERLFVSEGQAVNSGETLAVVV